jgi:signal transduction histidine kinase
LGVPLINKDKVVGALEAINKRSGDFNAEDQQILATLGAQAALAIENARLFQQSDLIAELVHELRTPLASLNTATHLLMRPDLPEEQRTHVAEIIQGEIFRLSDLASDFLDLARLESGRAQYHLSSIYPDKLISDCTELMRGRAVEKGLSLQLDLPASLPTIQADEDKLKQVLINLISNATKYNKPGGSITITAHTEPGALVISVSDTGHGIPAENLASLFQRFYRVPGTEKVAPGTGLGLSICKRIVEAHQGTIGVQSVVGKGSTFTVSLPV